MKHTVILIACNESLMIRKNLQHLYPHFDRIIVCDGPSAYARGQAGGDGRRITNGKPHSTDGTVEAIRSFQTHCDPAKKVLLRQKATPWTGKLEKFNDALKICEEGFVWQVDADEFLFDEDISTLQAHLKKDPNTSTVSFFARHFWGDPFHHFEIIEGKWGNVTPWTRIFNFKKGNRFYSHEPPLMLQATKKKPLTREQTHEMGINLFHFGYVHRTQLERREKFYNIPGQVLPEWDKWQKDKKQNVSGGKLIRYDGPWPISIDFMLPKKEEVLV